MLLYQVVVETIPVHRSRNLAIGNKLDSDFGIIIITFIKIIDNRRITMKRNSIMDIKAQ